jgi:hypothetical protein
MLRPVEGSTRRRRGSQTLKGSPHEAARRGSLEQRARYVAERRTAASSRTDDRRRQLARELGPRASTRIDPELGFAPAEPGSLPGTEAVIDSALGLIDRVGRDALRERVKKPMAKGFLPESELSLDSPYLRLALSDDVVAIVSDYLGMIPILTYVDVWYSPHVDRPTWSSQLFHLDHADVTQLKLFLHCGDVSSDSGPLTVLSASDSRRLAKRVNYRLEQTRVRRGRHRGRRPPTNGARWASWDCIFRRHQPLLSLWQQGASWRAAAGTRRTPVLDPVCLRVPRGLPTRGSIQGPCRTPQLRAGAPGARRGLRREELNPTHCCCWACFSASTLSCR